MENTNKAIFAAGCFWGVEANFMSLAGVTSTRVGYCASATEKVTTDQPTYKLVCNADTGYAEAVEVVFDPSVVNFQILLDLFWEIHDPTQMNRQGPDFGRQYRSAIFTLDENQRKIALEHKNQLNSRLPVRLVTEIAPAGTFHAAEDYHQQYFRKMGRPPSRLPTGFKRKAS